MIGRSRKKNSLPPSRHPHPSPPKIFRQSKRHARDMNRVARFRKPPLRPMKHVPKPQPTSIDHAISNTLFRAPGYRHTRHIKGGGGGIIVVSFQGPTSSHPIDHGGAEDTCYGIMVDALINRLIHADCRNPAGSSREKGCYTQKYVILHSLNTGRYSTVQCRIYVFTQHVRRVDGMPELFEAIQVRRVEVCVGEEGTGWVGGTVAQYLHFRTALI